MGEHPAARLGVGRWGRQDLGSRLLPRRVRRRQRHFRRTERDNQVSSHIRMSLLVSRHLSKHGFSCRRVSLNHRGHYSPASLRGHNVHSLITADHTLRDLSNQASASSEGYFACVSSFSCFGNLWEKFCNMFCDICLGSMAAAEQPNSLRNSQKTIYKTFLTSCRNIKHLVHVYVSRLYGPRM